MGLPAGYRHDFCNLCGKLIGHPEGTLPICAECAARKGEPPEPAIFWVCLISLLAFLGGVLALVEHGGLLGVLTLIAGSVAVVSWVIYQRQQKDGKVPSDKERLASGQAWLRHTEQDIRLLHAISEASEATAAFPDDAEAHHKLAALYEEDGQLEKALKEYRLADELANENDPEPDVPEFRADCERITYLLSRENPNQR